MAGDAPAGEPGMGDERGHRGEPRMGGERSPREGQGGEGDEQGGRRRRRRGRRGGRRRHGEGQGQGPGGQDGQPYAASPEPAGEGQPAPQRYETPRPAIIGPGHDLPDESPFRPNARNDGPRSDAPPRIEGPGDAHDWPWNRRNERFPEEVTPPLTPPSPFPATPDPAPRHEPSPAAKAPGEGPAAAEAPPADEPPSNEPKGPPRKGWWKRLTE